MTNISIVEEAIKDPMFSHYPKGKIQKFIEFHKKNPHVLDILENLSNEMYNTGKEKYGFQTIYAVLRWRHDLSTSGDKFKLNDLYRSLYARTLMFKHPKFKDFLNLELENTK